MEGTGEILGTMPTAEEVPLILSRLLDRGAQLQPENEIITRLASGYHRVTYVEALRTARRLATALIAAGIRRGDRVATFMWNNSQHLALYHAVPCMGAVLHTLNVRLGASELAFIITHAQDQALFADADIVPLLAAVDRAVLGSVPLFVVCGGETQPCERQSILPKSMVGLKAWNWNAFLQDTAELAQWPSDINENAAMALCYTSGTTGKPKGVAYSHRSTYLHTLASCMKDMHEVSGGDVLLPVVPMFHAMAWGLPFATTMLGTTLVLTGRYLDPASILECCMDHGVTYSAGVPTIWASIQAAIEGQLLNFKGRFKVEKIICGGSAPSPAMMAWYLQHFGTKFMQAWGMTETNPNATLSKFVQKRKHRQLTTEQQFENVKFAGVMVPGLEMRIVDPEDFSRELPRDGVASGELLVRGPWCTARYYKENFPDKFINGWLATGDVASIDAEDRLIIRDRSKDLIKSGGEWISSVDLEKHICALEGVVAAAVVAQPHPKWEERPVAVVVTGQGARGITADLVKAHVAKDFAKYEVPDDVLFWSELPMTGTGKLDKKRVRAMLQEQGYTLPSLRHTPAAKL